MVIKTVVYTAIIGQYDKLNIPTHVTPEFDYICYTDNKDLKSNFWQIRLIPKNDLLDNTRIARELKIRPHLLFPEYEISIWIDGNVEIRKDIKELIFRHTEELRQNLITFGHPLRDCIYEEALKCIEIKKDSEEIITKQMDKYRNLGYPINHGLVESNVIIRRHNAKEIIKFSESWWLEVKNFSKRDQLSFNYVSWNENVTYHLLEGNTRGSNDYFFASLNHQKPPLKYRIINKIKRILRYG